MGLRHQHDVVLLLGAPGAGKGTQARALAASLGVPAVASGDLLRQHRTLGTPLGQAARAFMDRGALVPDDLVIAIVMDRLDQPDAGRGALLDGFPRTLAQAAGLDARLAERDARVRTALYLDVPPAVLVDRLAGRWVCPTCQATYHQQLNPSPLGAHCGQCGSVLYQRPDDRREVVQNRVNVYLRETVPVIQHYETLGVLRRIDGDQPIERIRASLLAAASQDTVAAAQTPVPEPPRALARSTDEVSAGWLAA